ncbi:MAG: PPC domain-containing protein [Myxococcota bacterium]
MMAGAAGRVAVTLLCGVLVASCVDNAPAAAGDGCCESDQDCAEGFACADGMCSARCQTADDCSVGESCTEGVCRARNPVPNACKEGRFGEEGQNGNRDASASDARVGMDAAITRRDASSRDRMLELPDGRVIEPDGGDENDAGEIPDANILDRDGNVVIPDASRPDGNVVRPDGGGRDAGRPDGNIIRPDAGRPDAGRRDAGGGVDAALPCTGDDGFEPNDSAGAPATFSGTSVSGVGCNREEDWFLLSTTAGDDVNAVLTSSAANNMVFQLYDAQNTNLLIAESSLVAGGRALLASGLTGRTLLRVVSYTSSDASYTVQATITRPQQCTADAYEPNNTTNTATALGSGGVSGTICNSDSDWFSIQVDAVGSTVTVDMVPGANTGDLDMILFDSLGGEVGRSEAQAGVPEHISVTSLTTGAYKVHLYGWPQGSPNSGTGPYVLTAQVTPPSVCSDDGWEDNDSAQSFNTSINVGQTVDATLCPSDPDYYWLYLQVPSDIDVAVTSRAGTNVTLSLYNSGLQLMGQVSGNTGSVTTHLESAGADWYVVGVEGAPGENGLGYQLLATASGLCTGADNHEPNNDLSQAAAYTNPGVSGVLCNWESDWFRVEAGNGDTVTATVTSTNGGILDALQIYDQNFGLLADSAAWEESRVAQAVGVSGPVYIYVNAGDTEAVDFTLQVSRSNPNQCVPDGFEPNESQSAARTFVSPLTAQICSGDHDWYAIPVTEPGTEIVAIMYPDFNAQNLDMTLVAPNGSILMTGNAQAGQPEYLDVFVDTVGTYAAHVYGARSTNQGTYYLQVDTTTPNPECEDDFYEDNDRFETSSWIDGATQDLPLVLCPDDRDFFALYLEAGGTFEVEVSYEPVAPVRVTVFSSSQQTIGDSNTGSGYEYIRGDFLPPDYYFIRVRGQNTDEGLNYRLTARVAGLTCDGDLGEPNNDPSQATFMDLDADFSAVMCGNNDWADVYGIQPAVNQGVEVVLTMPQHPDGPLDAIITASDGFTQLASTYNQFGQVKTARADVRREGTYYVQIYNSWGVPDAVPYQVNITQLAELLCVDDDYEENDGPIEAAAATRGQAVDAIACPADNDYYAYQLSAGQVNIEMTSGFFDATFELVAPNGATVLATGYANWQPISYRVPTTGRYFVRVNYWNTPENGDPYTLLVQ